MQEHYFKLVEVERARDYQRLAAKGFPMPLIEITNGMLMINGGMALLQVGSKERAILQQPLCDPAYLFGILDRQHMDRIAKMLSALRESMIEIKLLADSKDPGTSSI